MSATLLLIFCCVYGDEKGKQPEAAQRYKIEILYTIHKNVTEEAYRRFEAVFGRAYPQLDLRKLEPAVKELRTYFDIYRDRLLEEAGSSWSQVKDEVHKEWEQQGKKGDVRELRDVQMKRGLALVADQVDRELRVRGMYQWFRDQAGRDGSKSLKELFDKLKKHDDPDKPVLATEPGQGVIVYRDFGGKPLTGEELENIEDSGIKFTHTFRVRVVEIDADVPDLPRLSRRAGVLGSAGHGRQIIRLMAVIEDAKHKKARQLRTAWRQLALYYRATQRRKMLHKRWPASLTEMADAIKKIGDDPWGNPFVLEKDGEETRIVSWGPDGKQRTDDDIRYAAKEAATALIAELKSKHRAVRGYAARALAGDVSAAKNAVPALSVALSDEDERVRAWAAYALSQVGPAARGAVSALSVALKDEDKDVRVNAANALAKIGPAATAAVPALRAALKDEDQGVRGWAAAALGVIGPAAREAVPALRAALKDEDQGVRGSAALALGEIGPAAKEAVPALVAALKDKDTSVRISVALALHRLDPETELAVPVLISALKDEDKLMRHRAASALGEIGPAAKEAIPALEAAARDGVKGAESALRQVRDGR